MNAEKTLYFGHFSLLSKQFIGKINRFGESSRLLPGNNLPQTFFQICELNEVILLLGNEVVNDLMLALRHEIFDVFVERDGVEFPADGKINGGTGVFD